MKRTVFLVVCLALIAGSALADGPSIKHDKAPNSVVEIASGAFSECDNLTSLVIGTNLKRIKQYAFYECGNMRKLTCKAVTPPVWEDDYLGDMNSEIMVYVPQQSVSLYRKAKGWKSLENIRPIPNNK